MTATPEHPSPPCPRCEYDTGHSFCPNQDGSITYRCYCCEHLWRVEQDDDFYMGDDARLNACRGLHTPRKDDEDV